MCLVMIVLGFEWCARVWVRWVFARRVPSTSRVIPLCNHCPSYSTTMSNQIQYSEKYYDNIYEYRYVRSPFRPSLSRANHREFLTAMWFFPPTSRNTCLRTACCRRPSGAPSACSRAVAGFTTPSTARNRTSCCSVARREETTELVPYRTAVRTQFSLQ